MRGAINLDGSDSDSGDDGDFFVPNNSDLASKTEHGVLADVEFLRQRNSDMEREISRIRGLHAERQEVLDLNQRKQELVWGSLPPRPWSMSFYLTFRGFEYLQLYLWILRDLGWAWGSILFYPTAVFGGFAIIHATLITFRDFWSKDPFESAKSFLRLLWVAAMYRLQLFTLSMTDNYRIEPLYVSNRVNRGHIPKPEIASLIVIRSDTLDCLIAIFSLAVIVIILKFRANRGLYPFKGGVFSVLGRTFTYATSFYESEPHLNLTALKFICTWRDLENLLLWFLFGRDLAFLANNQLMWAAFAFGSLLIPMALTHITMNIRPSLVEHCHYMAMMMWVAGVTVFEMGHVMFRGLYSAWDFAGP